MIFPYSPLWLKRTASVRVKIMQHFQYTYIILCLCVCKKPSFTFFSRWTIRSWPQTRVECFSATCSNAKWPIFAHMRKCRRFVWISWFSKTRQFNTDDLWTGMDRGFIWILSHFLIDFFQRESIIRMTIGFFVVSIFGF